MDRSLGFTVRIGVAEVEGDDDDTETVLKRANAALYAARRKGRNQLEAG